MCLLRFLQNSSSQVTDAVDIEYRLACSGELYNLRVQTLDWRKSEATRILLKTPVEFVISQPFANYPQELCARMTLRYVTEQTVGNVPVSVTLLPDGVGRGHIPLFDGDLCRRSVTAGLDSRLFSGKACDLEIVAK
jgi:hypothetical protein